ncbi:MAG TPA: tetratricopeptide repeat protein [Anaerolineales bacterium]|nr:tetratricopeptide repeat protein [Anaerolineales bacterium]
MHSVAAISPQSFGTFGELLRYLRERVELSQKELALQVGYHYSYMCRIEKNQRTPDLQTLMTRFIPALSLDDEPQWTARLLELAGRSKGDFTQKASLADLKPTSTSPPTALPIFDLSASRLPVFLTPLLGRDQDVIGLTNLLSRHDVRLVTLMGPPGVGKTRLAAHVAAQMAGMFANGPLFVDLTTVVDKHDFLPAIAGALGVLETSDAPLAKNLNAVLRHRNLLLVIDNFEHIIDAASHLPSLLMSAPDIKILVTSREALHISGEHEFTLSPLPLPQPASEKFQLPHEIDAPNEMFLRIPSVQLFTQRVQAIQPTFEITADNALTIAEICRKLDGLPLAIELAATCIKSLTPQAMLQQLDRRLDWLTRGSRDSMKQTLRETIEWSYNLLTEPERVILQRMSVFVDGCTLRAAESICADPSIPRAEILDVLVRLMDKSLVKAETNALQVRYHLLETVREFGREKLAQAGELDELLTRHLMHFTEYAEDSESHLDGTGQARWIRITEMEHGNFNAALNYALTQPKSLAYGLRIGAALSLYWLECNHYRDGIALLSKLLEQGVLPEHQAARARMLYRCGAIHARMSSYDTAYKLCEQSIELARALGNQRILASALVYLGEICTALNDFKRASILLEESLSICRANHLPTQLAIALTDLGKVLLETGETAQAISNAKEALTIAEGINDTWGLSHTLHFLGSLHRKIGEIDTAIYYFERSLPQSRELGDRLTEGTTLANLSSLYNLKEAYSAAGHAAEKSFVAFQAIGDEMHQPFPLRLMGYSAIQVGNIARARTLIVESLRGSYEQDHLPGQLSCLVAIGICELAQGNAEKAVTYAMLVKNRLDVESISLLEPDTVAFNKFLAAGKRELDAKSYKQIVEKSKTLHVGDVIASELTAAIKS